MRTETIADLACCLNFWLEFSRLVLVVETMVLLKSRLQVYDLLIIDLLCYCYNFGFYSKGQFITVGSREHCNLFTTTRSYKSDYNKIALWLNAIISDSLLKAVRISRWNLMKNKNKSKLFLLLKRVKPFETLMAWVDKMFYLDNNLKNNFWKTLLEQFHPSLFYFYGSSMWWNEMDVRRRKLVVVMYFLVRKNVTFCTCS